MNPLRDLLFHLSRLVIGCVFLYAGAIKAADMTAFAGSVAAYQLLPYSFNMLVAAILPYVEILAGVLLIFNTRVKPAALVLLLLDTVFILALATAIYRGLSIDCGCFSQDPNRAITTPQMALLRDLGLLVGILCAYLLAPAERRNRY